MGKERSMADPGPVLVIGDIHGELAKLTTLLQAAKIIDNAGHWCANNTELWFTGDFFDRGPDGIGVVELIMRLQTEAAACGGCVGALLGNHEPLFLGAWRFGSRRNGWGLSFRDCWERNGGQRTDMERLKPTHLAWLTNLPGMALVADRLLIHADATLYPEYGRSIEQVNAAFVNVLHSDDSDAWERLFDQFSERLAFADKRPGQPHPARQAQAAKLLELYGGRQIIHGHTPISTILGVRSEAVTQPLVYAAGLCVNVDSGMCAGGPGFVYTLPPLDPGEVQPAPPRRLSWKWL